MTDPGLLAFHRGLTAIPSVSGGEDRAAEFAAEALRRAGIAVNRVGSTVVALAGSGPAVVLDTHLDTVPPTAAWTRDPWVVETVEGRVFGLGSNDAKASAAAMAAAFLRLAARGDLGITVALVLAAEEETTNAGSAAAVDFLRARGIHPEAVVVGEPTGLDVAVAQKGLLVLEFVARGEGGTPPTPAPSAPGTRSRSWPATWPGWSR